MEEGGSACNQVPHSPGLVVGRQQIETSRSTSCSVFFFQIPVNADKDADGVVAAAAIVVDDALYILSTSCLFLFLQIRIGACW